MSIKLAVVGAGFIAEGEHLPCWKKIPQVEVVAVSDNNKERAESCARRWQIPGAYSDFSHLLRNLEKGSIIDICTPPNSHAGLAIEAMKAGCHVLVEKPMAMSVEETDEILKVYREEKDKGTRLCVVHNWLLFPQTFKIRDIVERELGAITGMEFKLLLTPSVQSLSNPNHWSHELPGGVFANHLIHPIYVLQSFMGSLELQSLWATKSGSSSYVRYDELYAFFSASKGWASVYISFNSPTSEHAQIIYGKKGVLWRLGDTRLVTSAYEGVINRRVDFVRRAYQLTMSTLGDTLRLALAKASRQLRTGHEILLRSFVYSILANTEAPLSPEEAGEANKTFLKVLQKLVESYY